MIEIVTQAKVNGWSVDQQHHGNGKPSGYHDAS